MSTSTKGSTNPNDRDIGNVPKRVAVAMSGGVDSSVAAALLVDQGYEVIGLMMRLWSEPGAQSRSTYNRCCTPEQMADARSVAAQLDIPFYAVDVQDYFYDKVVRYFIDQHDQGFTPNPCIECNRKIRFDYLYQHAMSLGVDYLATGHYARIRQSGDQYHLLQAVDHQKDQSYVLHVLNQERLARVMFPIGNYTKEQVRKLAESFNLSVAQKSESMDLCFLKDGDYRRFLQEHSSNQDTPGVIVDTDGNQLGKHDGLSKYTIGQRKGLGLALGQPVYVHSKDIKQNTITVTRKANIYKKCLTASNVNWVSGRFPGGQFTGDVKIRYRAKAISATIDPISRHTVIVHFDEPVFGITPGQGAVFYLGQECLGGGIISDQECT